MSQVKSTNTMTPTTNADCKSNNLLDSHFKNSMETINNSQPINYQNYFYPPYLTNSQNKLIETSKVSQPTISPSNMTPKHSGDSNNLIGNKRNRKEQPNAPFVPNNMREMNNIPNKLGLPRIRENYEINHRQVNQNSNPNYNTPNQFFSKFPIGRDLNIWTCSNPNCNFKKNYSTRSHCYVCNSEKSPNAEIIEINLSNDNRQVMNNFDHAGGEFVHKPISKKFYTRERYAKQYGSNFAHDRNYLPKRHNIFTGTGSVNSLQDSNSSSNININNNSNSTVPLKIVPDSSVIISNYSYQEIEKAVTFLKIVDKIKNKEKLMNMIRNLAAEEENQTEKEKSSTEESEKLSFPKKA